MKKILFLTKDFSLLGGVERVIESLSKSFSREYDCHILTIVDSDYEKEYSLSNVKSLDLSLPLNTIGLFKYHIKTLYGIYKAIKNHKYDYIIANSPSLSSITIIANIISGKKSNVICYEHNTFSFPNKLWTFLRKYLFKYSHATIALTKDSYDEYKKIDANPIQIYNPITIDIREPSRCDGYNILSVGRLTRQKGFDYLIDIFNNALKLNGNLHLDIVGDGPEREMLENKIKMLNLSDNVVLHGSQSNIQEFYNRADLYVMTSRYEGFPLVLAEAMGHGLPVISFNCKSGPSDIVVEGYNGYLIKENDINSFSKKIDEIFSDRDLLKNLSRNAILSSKEFSIENISQQWKLKIFNNEK